MPARYWILIVILGIAFGSSFYFNAVLLRELGPVTISFGRITLGALGCWIWILASGKNPRISRLALGQLAVLGAFQYAAPLTFLPLAQEHISSGMAGTVNGMTPVMVVLLSHFWSGGENMTWTKSFGVVFGFLGIVTLTGPALQSGGTEFWAILIAFLAPVSYAIALNYVRRFQSIDPAVMTTWALTCAAGLLAPTALVTEGVPVITHLETWAALAAVGFGMTSICFLLIFWLLPRTGATTVSTVTFVAPISAVVLGVLFLSESLAATHVAGMGIILAGLLLIDGRAARLFLPAKPATSA